MANFNVKYFVLIAFVIFPSFNYASAESWSWNASPYITNESSHKHGLCSNGSEFLLEWDFRYLTIQGYTDYGVQEHERNGRRVSFVKSQNILVGRNKSVFDINVSSNLNVLENSANEPLQTQVRVEHKNWTFSLENSESEILASNSRGDTNENVSRSPDFVAHFRKNTRWGEFQAASVLRKIRWLGSEKVDGETDLGFGLGFSLKKPIKDGYVNGAVKIGKGLGQYSGFDELRSAVVQEENGLEVISASSAKLALSKNWMPRWDTSLAFSVLNVNSPNHIDDQSFIRFISEGGINVLYALDDNLSFGFGLKHDRRTTVQNKSLQENKYQLSAKYHF